jgi:5'-3' exonuclease
LWAGYKSSAGMPRELLAQFPLVESAMEMAGFAVWPQVAFEADDGMAAAAVMAAADPRVGQVIICTPDKDLGQCVGGKVVQLDRRKGVTFDAAGVEERLGVPPVSIPDLLALVGDSADGFPGLAGCGDGATSRTSPPTPRRGTPASAARPSSTPSCASSSSWPCCSGGSPRSRSTPR